MRIRSLTTMLALAVLLPAAAIAQDKVVADHDDQKSAQGFTGKLLLTQDKDWKQKWASPETPRFGQSDTVKLGESITALVFFINAALDTKGEIHIRCDFLITRPDGSVSTDAKDVGCYDGPIQGSPHNVRLVQITPEFIGEASDLPGTWVINVRLTDTVRKVSLDLKAPFEYQKP